MDSSLPGSAVHGIFQARVLEWGAIEDLKIIIFLNLKNVNSKNVSRTFSGVVVGSVGSVQFQIVSCFSLFFSRSIGPFQCNWC